MRRRTLFVAAFALLFTAAAGLSGDAAPQNPAGATPSGQPQAAEPAPAQAGDPQPADRQTPADQPPIFRGGINFVRVDAIVTDRSGKPVAGLEAGDFEITEDGQPQKVETFKVVELDGGLIPGSDGPPRTIRTDTDEETEASRDDVRLFGVFLDDYHVRLETSLRAREDLARFVETQLGPSDMIGLMYPLEPLASVRFSRNHAGIARGLLQFKGRKYDYTPLNDIEQQYAYYPTETVERIRNQVSLSAINGLIIRMGSLKEGRKALLLVSEGYTYMVPPQLRSRVAGTPDFDNPARNNPLAGSNSLVEDRAAFLAGTEMEMDLREIYTLANRNNVAIYTVDPRGLATSEFGIDQNIGNSLDRTYLNSTMDTLRTLADETDGRAIVNRNDLTMAMKQIVMDSSVYYLLGYSSTVAPSDGKFHEIKVRVKKPGLQVRARRGYWALTVAETKRALAPSKPEPPSAVQQALAAISQPAARARPIRTWFGTERGASGKTRVTFLWEATPRPGARGSDTPATVLLTAVGKDGSLFYRGRVPAKDARVSFDAAPGPMEVRLSVEDADAGVLDSESRDVPVPDLTAPQTSLSTPQLFRARTVRELEQVKTDPKAVPTAAREFSRTERVFVRVQAYGPGASTPALSARLLNRGGETMAELPIDGAEAGIDLPLASLAPGEYLLQITAAGEAGEAQELIGFRVTS